MENQMVQNSRNKIGLTFNKLYFVFSEFGSLSTVLQEQTRRIYQHKHIALWVNYFVDSAWQGCWTVDATIR